MKRHIEIIPSVKLEDLIQETNELIAIFVTIDKKNKQKSQR